MAKKKMGHWEHFGALFSRYSVLLERSRQDNSNHTLKNHQTWS
jgi:hypothetical protein